MIRRFKAFAVFCVAVGLSVPAISDTPEGGKQLTVERASQATCKAIELRALHAWNDLQPPGPPRFHLYAEAYVANPGIVPVIVRREPQGFNQKILLLNIELRQEPGIWPAVFVWRATAYHELNSAEPFDQVQIFCGNTVVADGKVHNAN